MKHLNTFINEALNKSAIFILHFNDSNVPSKELLKDWTDDDFKGWPLNIIGSMYEETWSSDEGYNVACEVEKKDVDKFKKWLNSSNISYSVVN